MKVTIGVAMTAVFFFTLSAFTADVQPVQGCRFSGIESDFCLATDGTSAYQISNCVNNNSASSCGIDVPTIPMPIIAD